jgi:hypothetical protein
MIWNVAYVVGSAVGSGGAGRPGAEGTGFRPRLAGRLGASARVTVVSAPLGSGKAVLQRSQVWLVLNDVHELGPDALPQLELLIMRARRARGWCWPPGMTVQGLLGAGRPAAGGVRSRWLSHGPGAWVPGEGERDDRRIDKVLPGVRS